jgi:hypothetical protein
MLRRVALVRTHVSEVYHSHCHENLKSYIDIWKTEKARIILLVSVSGYKDDRKMELSHYHI